MSKSQTSWSAGRDATISPRARRLRPNPEVDRGRQIVRLLRILRALESTTRGLSPRELKEQLELDCSERTVYRDLSHLERAGFGVLVEEHRYRLAPLSHLRAEPLRASQLLSLLVARDLLLSLNGSEIVQGLDSLTASLRARLAPEGRRWLDALGGLVAVTLPSPPLESTHPALAVVQEALELEQLLEIDYLAPGKPLACRTVEPHLLWTSGSRSYLVAFCRGAAAFRTFALARIQGARLLDDEFERRPDFDPNEYVRRGFGVLHGPTHEVVVRFESDVAHLAQERLWHPSQVLRIGPAGTVDLRMTVGGLPEVAAWIAGFGGRVRALEPQELVTRVRALHQAGLDGHSLQRDLDRAQSGSHAPRLMRLTSDVTEVS